MSNFYCHPGKAGGSPDDFRNVTLRWNCGAREYGMGWVEMSERELRRAEVLASVLRAE
jgi:hypothetical protein